MKERKRRIYIAHSLGLRKDVAGIVIPKMELYFEVENPFATRLNDFGDMSEEEIRSNRGWVVPSWVVKHDLGMIDKCDGMLVINTGGASYGSAIEASYCFYVANIPVAFVTQEKYANHPWLRHYTIHSSTDHEKAIEALRTFFNIRKSVHQSEEYATIERTYVKNLEAEAKENEGKGT
jgi:hypothetical protein